LAEGEAGRAWSIYHPLGNMHATVELAQSSENQFLKRFREPTTQTTDRLWE
jgi:hypothetical protein